MDERITIKENEEVKGMLHLYRRPAYSEAKIGMMMTLQKDVFPIEIVASEYCYNIEGAEDLTSEKRETLEWVLSETFDPEDFSDKSFLSESSLDKKFYCILEVGPREGNTTPWCTNAVSVCRASGLNEITKMERSLRFLLKMQIPWDNESLKSHLTAFYDRARECVYEKSLESFQTGVVPETVFEVRLIEDGKSALEKINRAMGFGLDDWDIDYYYNLFVNGIGRNPTNVECFDLAQSNSEHSRHWFFKGKLIVDGVEVPHDLMKLIRGPLDAQKETNSVIAFNDNSSSIRGYEIEIIIPERPGWPSRFKKFIRNYDIIFTAETHNFPSGVAPFPGAETGTGGRIRDVEATGRGGLVVAGTAAYCVGNLHIPGYELPWEDKSFIYPTNLATPLEIEIKASNGASDYGNKFGEPVIQGYTRSFGMRILSGERYEWLKPIMFTAGVGQMDASHVEKGEPEEGMLVIKIGGPAYRIGIGGGAASSHISGENVAELDFNAVQRGDAEMAQKANRVIRTCVEMGEENPIVSIHDQGAGGNCNVIKEIIYPAGARIEVRKIQLGDNTLSVLEIWGAEYQEQNAILLRPEDYGMFEKVCMREKVPCASIGRITGDGYIVLYDENDGSTPVNLSLNKILGDMPQKTFHLDRIPIKHEPLELPEITMREMLDKVLRLLSVGSKRFLTNKVDRSVTGLIAQQQCCGSLQLPVSDVAVIAQSHFGLTGAAISIGECPVRTLIDPAAMARMAMGEAVTNIVWAKLSSLEDIKCSGNWMWAAKLPGEGAKLYDAAVALSDILTKLGIAIDGGKDSLSMAAVVGDEKVKAPGTLVMSAYCTVPDITRVITPDIKRPGTSKLLFIDLGNGKNRLGGSALAQVFNQLGNESPDVDDPDLLKRAWNVVQELISEDLILAGHDRSDGGLITTLLEMAFAGNCGVDVNLPSEKVIPMLFSEELGLLVEAAPKAVSKVLARFEESKVSCIEIGDTANDGKITVSCDGKIVLYEDMRVLRQIWEETSHQLERLQCKPECAEEEKENIFDRRGPLYHLTFEPEDTALAILNAEVKPKVAIIREEGSNSDREMTSAFYQAGFDPWDITMTDFLEGRITLTDFRGIAFVGGFSYADVLDSAKGWAGVIRFGKKVVNKVKKLFGVDTPAEELPKKIWDEFQSFYNRKNTFSFGVCNGCQLMALLGWIPWQGIEMKSQPRFIHNTSGRFESRWSSVKILPSPAIMLDGMEGSVLGIHVAHGEGRAYFPDKDILESVREKCLAPIRYADDEKLVTRKYPFNPNGSEEGIAGFCSPDGRHLAMMPHPERAFLNWQWPWMPEDWRDLKASPWMEMFQNARKWCEND